MRKKLNGKFLPVIIAAVLLITLVPLVSAYEAHTVNVKVRVETYNCTKTVRLADEIDIEEARDMGINFPSTPNPWLCDPPLMPPPPSDNVVPIKTCVVWVVRISISNPEEGGSCWTEVVVKDNFSAEVAGETLDEVPVDVMVRTQTRGNSTKKGSFQSQTRILWYVTCEDWDPVNEECNDNSGELCPGESAYLEMYVWTKLNPSGKQSYTSTGNYTLNSGPTAKWFNDEGHQFSFDAKPVYIYAYD